MGSGTMIAWDRPMLNRFKAEYDKHKQNRDAVFEFDGNEFLVSYAGYLIEYLETCI